FSQAGCISESKLVCIGCCFLVSNKRQDFVNDLFVEDPMRLPNNEIQFWSKLNPRRQLIFPSFSFRPVSPPHSAITPCAVPTMTPIRIHCSCHVVLLGDPLLDTEVLVTLILSFVPDIGDARLLVFENVCRLSLRGHPFNLVGRKFRVDLLLKRRVRRKGMKAGL